MRHRRYPTITAFSITLALIPAMLSGCGTGRSVQAYCDTMQNHKDQYLQAMADATKQVKKGSGAGIVRGLTESISALGDIQGMWDELVQVAPDDIRPDVESVRGTSAKELDNAKLAVRDPVAALGAALVIALVDRGPIRRVDAYTRANCTG